MTAPHKKYRFLFVSLLILGKETAYRNMRATISRMDDIEPTWLPIEMNPGELIARIPPVSMSHPLKYGLVARARVRALERSGSAFDAAFFNHILVTPFLKGFRLRVPSVDAMDVTPASLLRDGQPYYDKPRTGGGLTAAEMKRRLARSVFTTARHLLPQSEYARESLVRDYGIEPSKTTVLAPGVDLSVWPGRTAHTAGQGGDAGLTVLFVGGEFVRKGGDLLMRTAARAEFGGWRFHAVTRDDPPDVPPNVVIHRNVRANSDDLRRLYEQADVFVLPTRADFAPTNSICEAMAMGLPVITTGVGGLDENVVDGETGFIVPVNDADALAERLRMVGDNDALRLRMGCNARRLAETKFNSAVNARAIIELMKKSADEM